MKRLEPLTLPDFETCEEDYKHGVADALEDFIYHYSPPMKEYKAWMAKLQMAIQSVVMDFIEKSTKEGSPDLSVIWRDDGTRFFMNGDGTYSMDPLLCQGDTIPYRYKLKRLLETGQFTFWPPLSSGKNLSEKAKA